MKFFYLTGSIIFTVIILILGFENGAAQCNFISIFFSSLPPSFSPAFLFFGLAGLGIVTGVFYFGFISSLLKEGKDDDESSTDW